MSDTGAPLANRADFDLDPDEPTPEAWSDGYGSPAHEAWLVEMEATDVPDDRPDQPWTPCGCTARAYGGDCAHTLSAEDRGDHPDDHLPVVGEGGRRCERCNLLPEEHGAEAEAEADPDDVCGDCGHPGYDGHDMRSVPAACLTPGCHCGRPAVILNHLHSLDSAIWPEGSGYTVDVVNYEGLGLDDTTSQWWPQARWVEATQYAEMVAAMLHLPMIYPTGEVAYPTGRPLVAPKGGQS